jgi:pyridoxamine 5'-phosphate oxidase
VIDIKDPIFEAAQWVEQAKSDPQILNPTAMCLSTIDLNGFPDARVVLLKGATKEGFMFFTNTHSNKGQALEKTPKAALTFYWEKLGKQIRIQGEVVFVSDQESDDYFHTRPRMSQIGAIASEQSQPLENRDILIQKTEALEKTFDGVQVPRPAHWKGYLLKPHKIEFWIDRPYRLHDRFLFTLENSHWHCVRLYP